MSNLEYHEIYAPARCDYMRPGYKYQFKLKNEDIVYKVYLMGFSIENVSSEFMEIVYQFESELDELKSFKKTEIDETTLMEMTSHRISPSYA